MKKLLLVFIISTGITIPVYPLELNKKFIKVKEVKLSLEKCNVTIIKRMDHEDAIDIKFVNDKSVPSPTIEFNNNRLTINQSYAGGMFTKEAELQLIVPDGVVFDITIEDGDLVITKVKGSFASFLHNGKIQGDLATTGISRFESESGKVYVKLQDALNFSILVASGSSNATLDFAGFKIYGKIKMVAFYSKGAIIAPLSFERQEIVKSDGPDYITKSVTIGDKDIDITLSTGPGTIEIIK